MGGMRLADGEILASTARNVYPQARQNKTPPAPEGDGRRRECPNAYNRTWTPMPKSTLSVKLPPLKVTDGSR